MTTDDPKPIVPDTGWKQNSQKKQKIYKDRITIL